MIVYFAGAAVAIFGLVIGSFLNVAITRLPAGQRISGRSRCPRCGNLISWRHNIPILSFAVLGRRCAHCRKPISWQYPAVELATAALFALVILKYAVATGVSVGVFSVIRSSQFAMYPWVSAIRDLFFVSVLEVVFVIDLQRYLILDSITLPAAAIAFVANLLLGRSWVELVFGGILGAGFFGAQFVVSSGRWIGDGDIRLGLLLGLMLGWPQLLVCLFFAYALGAVVGLGLIAAGRKQFGSAVPFGTFLSAAGAFALLYGDTVIRWYLHFLSM